MNIESQMLRRRPQSNPSPTTFISDDLIVDIISWFRVKPLMRMKCVSKSFNILISDPKFIKLHLNRSSRNSQSCVVSFPRVRCNGYLSFVSFSISDLFENRLMTIANDPNDRYYELADKDCLELIGSCNGLVCLLGYYVTDDDVDDDYIAMDEDDNERWFRIWNPATRTISNKLGYFGNDMHQLKFWKFTFGYDNSTDTYKVVALHLGNDLTTEVRVFSLGDNSWRNIQSFNVVPVQLALYSAREYTGVYLNGTVNWMALGIDVDFVIISLDLGTERHTQMLVPPYLDFKVVMHVQAGVFVLMDSLCFYHDIMKTDFVIWKMTKFGDEKSWTQFLKFSYHDDIGRMNFISNPPYFKLYENDDILVFAEDKQDRAILYNWRNSRSVEIRVNRKICWYSINNYVESLVSAF